MADETSKQRPGLSRYKGGMIFVRPLVALTLLGLVAAAPSYAAIAPATPSSWQFVGRDRENQHDRETPDEEQSEARAAGIISGSVVGVDYAHGFMRLAGARGVVDVVVLPGTAIIRRSNEYGTIADLIRGAHVSVYVSQVGGRLVAELIRIR
ncbi:MAG: hypothetical protein JO024_04595 [Candidatus Eremiobacteraeota bacterium]|nr:hypothetical protein [Candidatus Eremiobacteraeota bacterium]